MALLMPLMFAPEHRIPAMQKTHPRAASPTQGFPPIPAPHPAYAEITRLLHTVSDARRKVRNAEVLRGRSLVVDLTILVIPAS